MEWLLKSKNLVKQGIADHLGVTLEEAELIIQCRNDIAHSNISVKNAIEKAMYGHPDGLSEAKKRGLKNLTTEHSDLLEINDDKLYDYAYANYLGSLTLKAFASKIGYTGSLGTLLPV